MLGSIFSSDAQNYMKRKKKEDDDLFNVVKFLVFLKRNMESLQKK
jgi:hypothetical protein